MKHFYEIKSIGMESEVKMNSRTVTGYFSRFNNIDHDGDLIVSGAFKKTIKERGQDGANLIVHLTDHKMDTGSLLGKPKLSESYDGGIFETTISDTTKGNDILKLYRDGVINQHSFGFRTIKQSKREAYNEIQEAMIYEVSTVILGANQETPFTGFKGLKADDLIERYQTLKKAYYDGDYSDEVFPILNAQIKQIEQDMIQEFINLKVATTDTQPDEIKAIEPLKEANEELYLGLKLLTLKHF
jgi:uncharacterized protein